MTPTPCKYCGPNVRTGLPGNACENCMNTGWEDGIEPDPDSLCPICDVPFKLKDECATDINEGTCHAACLEGSAVVNLETGDEIPDAKIGTFPYEDEPFMVREITIDEGDSPSRWVDLMTTTARNKGATFSRVSHDAVEPRHMLFEAWHERPNDQGPQRWGACK